jgi:hypothetical protein
MCLARLDNRHTRERVPLLFSCYLQERRARRTQRGYNSGRRFRSRGSPILAVDATLPKPGKRGPYKKPV